MVPDNISTGTNGFIPKSFITFIIDLTTNNYRYHNSAVSLLPNLSNEMNSEGDADEPVNKVRDGQVDED